jgi:hypothetical protein
LGDSCSLDQATQRFRDQTTRRRVVRNQRSGSNVEERSEGGSSDKGSSSDIGESSSDEEEVGGSRRTTHSQYYVEDEAAASAMNLANAQSRVAANSAATRRPLSFPTAPGVRGRPATQQAVYQSAKVELANDSFPRRGVSPSALDQSPRVELGDDTYVRRGVSPSALDRAPRVQMTNDNNFVRRGVSPSALDRVPMAVSSDSAVVSAQRDVKQAPAAGSEGAAAAADDEVFGSRMAVRSQLLPPDAGQQESRRWREGEARMLGGDHYDGASSDGFQLNSDELNKLLALIAGDTDDQDRPPKPDELFL